MRNAVLVYFTDGLGETELKVQPLNRRTLWVLTGKEEKLSLTDPRGGVLRLSKSKTYEKINTYELIRNELRDSMNEWAK
jgi:predicted metal-dependent peptidase